MGRVLEADQGTECSFGDETPPTQANDRQLAPGYELASDELEVPAIAAEAVVGGIWQVFHHYADDDRIAELPAAAAQLTYFALAPFVGAAKAALYALPDSA